MKGFRLFAVMLPLCSVFCETGAASAVSPEVFFEMIAENDRVGVMSAVIGGFDLNVYDMTSGSTPLMHAIRKARPGMVEILLDSGADVNLNDFKNADGISPLMLAVMSATAPASPNMTPERRRGAMGIFDMLIGRRAEINYMEPNGMTALSWALSGMDRESCEIVVSKLLEAGADVNPPVPPQKWSPLMWAVGNAYLRELETGEDHTGLIKLMLEPAPIQTSRLTAIRRSTPSRSLSAKSQRAFPRPACRPGIRHG